jgi:MFS transporter, UMF1 family
VGRVEVVAGMLVVGMGGDVVVGSRDRVVEVGGGEVVVVGTAANSWPVEQAPRTRRNTRRGRRIEPRLCICSPCVSHITKNDRRTIFGWAMYDWANSAYITTFAAIVAAFFTAVIVPDDGYNGLSGETLWSAVISIGAFVLFLVMPVLGAIADYSYAKKRFLRFFAWFGALVTIAMPLVPSGSVPLFLLVVVLSQIGFVAANVFYDGFLPDISTDDTIDRVSSKGYALGYVGGGLYVLLALVLILLSGDGGMTGLSEETASRIGIAGAGLWWLGFATFSLRRLPEEAASVDLPEEYRGEATWVGLARLGFARTVATARKLFGFKHLMLFVLAFLFYNDAVQTVIAVTGAYAEETLGLGTTEIIIVFLIVQFVAFFGALMFGAIAGRIGAKGAIMASLVVWVLVAGAAYFLPEGEALPLYGLAVVVGFVLGGVQALSRSLYGTMIPEEASAEFYGFFSVFSKFSAIWGPLVFAVVSNATGSGRPAILSVVAFFVIGLVLLATVNVAEAKASRERWSFENA